MKMYATEFFYSTSTYPRPGHYLKPLLCIIRDTRVWLAGVTGSPSPKRPLSTSLMYFVIALALTECSTPNSVRAVVSEPLLTTSGMTRMELEKVVRASYLREGCIPYEISTTPTRYFVEYLCKGDLVEPRRFRWGLTWSKPQTAPDDWCFTQQDTCRYQVGRSLYVTTLRQKQKREKCEEVK